ncbi:MAG: hypothetical protein V7K48_26625 [Nostoc sp.]|uniref:hypothetical protein n=1 Tax=Nostoc sp. TaxID=1180 RepID=UPI002FFC30B5
MHSGLGAGSTLSRCGDRFLKTTKNKPGRYKRRYDACSIVRAEGDVVNSETG